MSLNPTLVLTFSATQNNRDDAQLIKRERLTDEQVTEEQTRSVHKTDKDRIHRRFHNGANVQLPRPLTDSWDWQLGARCRGRLIDDFYPALARTAQGRSDRRRRERAAVEVCNTCTVIEQCREYALRTREPYGVWGGLTEEERKEILYFRAEPSRRW